MWKISRSNTSGEECDSTDAGKKFHVSLFSDALMTVLTVSEICTDIIPQT